MFEVEGSNLRFEFANRAASEEDIIFLIAVCTDVYCLSAVYMGMARRDTEGATCGGSTVFCWMSESPAVLALTWEDCKV